jgi:hypothetical protein
MKPPGSIEVTNLHERGGVHVHKALDGEYVVTGAEQRRKIVVDD